MRDVLTALVGVEQIQIDWFIELGQDFLGAARQGVQVVLGKIDARATEQHVDDQHETDEQHDQDDQCAAGKSLSIGCHGQASSVGFFQVDHDRAGIQPEADHQDEIEQIAKIDHALADRGEVGEETQAGDCIDQHLWSP